MAAAVVVTMVETVVHRTNATVHMAHLRQWIFLAALITDTTRTKTKTV